MGMFDWLFGPGDLIGSEGKTVTTKVGKAAYELAQVIDDTEDKPRWKELMNLYYNTSDPAAKVEVLRMATALAKVAGVTAWKHEVTAKREQLQKRGYL